MGDVRSIDPNAVPVDAWILDVREDDEWFVGHIPGAHHIPLSDLPSRLNELPPTGEIHIVCRTGGRSEKACQWLASNGIDAVNIDGGMVRWVGLDREISADPAHNAEPYIR